MEPRLLRHRVFADRFVDGGHLHAHKRAGGAAGGGSGPLSQAGHAQSSREAGHRPRRRRGGSVGEQRAVSGGGLSHQRGGLVAGRQPVLLLRAESRADVAGRERGRPRRRHAPDGAARQDGGLDRAAGRPLVPEGWDVPAGQRPQRLAAHLPLFGGR